MPQAASLRFRENLPLKLRWIKASPNTFVPLNKAMKRWAFGFALALGLATIGRADQLLMKDGTVLKGKILKESSKLILIGNPPFDPKEYIVHTEDVDKIIHEEYKPLPPAERRVG